MSSEIHAFIKREQVPTPAAWQTAIEKTNIDLTIDQNFTPFVFSGFLHCIIYSSDSGFELDYETATETLECYPGITQKVAGREIVITMRYGGDLEECACSLIAATALKESFDAVIFDPQANAICSSRYLNDQISDSLSCPVERHVDRYVEIAIPVPQKQQKSWWQFWK